MLHFQTPNFAEVYLQCLPGAPACQGHILGSMRPDTDRSNNYVACCSTQHSLSLDSTADKSIAGMLLQSPQNAVRTGLDKCLWLVQTNWRCTHFLFAVLHLIIRSIPVPLQPYQYQEPHAHWLARELL